jgi:N-acetylneuraminic acid mutarotase
MEIYPIYEQNTEIAPNLWYSLSGQGESPCMRVGHSIVQVKDENNKHDKGKLCIVGGANPSELFSDIYMFDLENLSWDRFDDFEQFKPGRYEHACIYEKKEKNIFIYGGCTETGNCNDVFKVDLEKKTCESVICKNSAPTARTIHSGVMYKNQLVIFGGGAATKTPVPDQNVYIFDPPSYKWISLNISKDSKTPITRQGHLLINYNDQLIILHGGLNENELFDDLWSVDFNKMEWKEIFFSKEESRFPLKRAAHGGVSINNNIYIFGGIGPDNAALDDLWKFDLGRLFFYFQCFDCS